MEISGFLNNLSHVGGSPYAFAAYIAVVAAWVYATVARHRLSKIGDLLKDLPPKDRTQLILREYSSAPRSGLSAEQWIKSRQHLLLFLAFLSLVVCLTLIVIIALVGSVAPSRTGDKGTEPIEALVGTQRAQSQQILDLQTRVDALTAQAAKSAAQAAESNAALASLQTANADVRLVVLMKELYRDYDDPDPTIDSIFSDQSLSIQDTVTFARLALMRKIDRDIGDQARRVEQLQNSMAQNPREIDVETIKLKRLIDKRSQQFDLLRKTIDKYNETARAIIDSMGR